MTTPVFDFKKLLPDSVTAPSPIKIVLSTSFHRQVDSYCSVDWPALERHLSELTSAGYEIKHMAYQYEHYEEQSMDCDRVVFVLQRRYSSESHCTRCCPEVID